LFLFWAGPWDLFFSQIISVVKDDGGRPAVATLFCLHREWGQSVSPSKPSQECSDGMHVLDS